jgi:hypothetical protein
LKPAVIAGAVYPIPYTLAGRIFHEGKTVFAKYTRGPWKLKVGDKILFYASYQIHAIIGEATIRTIEYLDHREVLAKYYSDLFITPEEFETYRRGRDRKLLVFSLEHIKQYSTPINFRTPVTLQGQYITVEEYTGLVHK